MMGDLRLKKGLWWGLGWSVRVVGNAGEECFSACFDFGKYGVIIWVQAMKNQVSAVPEKSEDGGAVEMGLN